MTLATRAAPATPQLAQQQLAGALCDIQGARYDRIREVAKLVRAGADPWREAGLLPAIALARGVLNARPLLDAIAPWPWQEAPKVRSGRRRVPLLDALLEQESDIWNFRATLQWWIGRAEPLALQTMTADLNRCVMKALATKTPEPCRARALYAVSRLLAAGVVADESTVAVLQQRQQMPRREGGAQSRSIASLFSDSTAFSQAGSAPGERAAARATFACLADLGLSLNEPDVPGGETPLARAMLVGNYDVANALLDCGASPGRNLRGAACPFDIGLGTMDGASSVDPDLVEILDRMRALRARLAAGATLGAAQGTFLEPS